MRFVRLLPERWEKFLREVLKFGAVGGLNFVINYAVFNALALTVFADGQLKANVIATVVATISSYLMNRHWTYRDRPKSAMRREYALFFLFNGAGLVIELGVLALAKYGFGITGLLALNVAKTVGVGLATVFRFWSYRTFVFRKSPGAAFGPSGTPGPASGGPSGSGAVHRTSGSGSAEEPDGEVLAELDPVAELAEAVSELSGGDTLDPRAATQDTRAVAPDGRAASPDNRGAGDGAGSRVAGAPAGGSAAPLEVQFAETLDAALETELAAELNAAPGRSSAREAAR
ncbi:GtrA family protein [Micromonospora sp. WMMD1102]|uniref:GtrA family protein n=1 Tax=Micromonospora sp. WMMD1102 TaxID=3016105 RepID=UPI0024150849|nr:GtrA family protein [Micromonospora sp. WMMD1102]MDG4784529.1 GtrA family protein [Micromonospora sp. WMMD1102]